jgi:hypothetical protein
MKDQFIKVDIKPKLNLYATHYIDFIGNIILQDIWSENKPVMVLWGKEICNTGFKKPIIDEYVLLGEIQAYHPVNRMDDTLEPLYREMEDAYYNSYDLYDINTNIVKYKGLYGMFNESGLLLHILSVKE